MSCKMLLFDFRESEEKFFKENKFNNFEIKFFKESLAETTLDMLSEEDFEETMIISVFITSTINEKVISKFKNLRVISTRSTGYDHICLNSCVNKHIALVNVNSYGVTSVAQFTIGVLISLIRNLYSAIGAVYDDSFHSLDFCGRDLNTLTLGIIGTGAIGKSVIEMASCFGMKVLAYDIRPQEELIEEFGVEYVDFDTLLSDSDVISLHLPYTKDNYHMISDEQFVKMKDGVYFINVSRGELVNTNALAEFATNGKFRGIALDVVACPDVNSDKNGERERSSVFCVETSKSVQELSKLPNVILTPHMAYNTQESVDYILKVTFENLSDYVTGGRKNRVI